MTFQKLLILSLLATSLPLANAQTPTAQSLKEEIARIEAAIANSESEIKNGERLFVLSQIQGPLMALGVGLEAIRTNRNFQSLETVEEFNTRKALEARLEIVQQDILNNTDPSKESEGLTKQDVELREARENTLHAEATRLMHELKNPVRPCCVGKKKYSAMTVLKNNTMKASAGAILLVASTSFMYFGGNHFEGQVKLNEDELRSLQEQLEQAKAALSQYE